LHYDSENNLASFEYHDVVQEHSDNLVPIHWKEDVVITKFGGESLRGFESFELKGTIGYITYLWLGYIVYIV
jgi:hypothetical protein